MEDFRIKTSWRSHRKRRRLRRLLGAEGVLAIEDLWSYCAAERESGDLEGMSNADIADEVAWEGEPDELVDALVVCELLDGERGAYLIHDWVDHNPYVATGDARSLKAEYKAHVRWHVKRGQPKDGCTWCSVDAVASDPDAESNACSNAPASDCNAPPLPPSHHPSEGRSRAREVAEAVLEARNRAAAECGLSAPGNELERRLADLVPFQPGALDYALEQTAKADKPNWTYLLRCLKDPTPRARGSPRRGDPTVGSHPPSTEYGNGPQQL